MARSRTRTMLWTVAAVIALAILPPALEAGSRGSTTITIRLMGDGWGKAQAARPASSLSDQGREDTPTIVEKLRASWKQLRQVYRPGEVERILSEVSRDAVVLEDGRPDVEAIAEAGWIERVDDGTVYSL